MYPCCDRVATPNHGKRILMAIDKWGWDRSALRLSKTLAHSNLPVEKIAFFPSPFPYSIFLKNLHALTLGQCYSIGVRLPVLRRTLTNPPSRFRPSSSGVAIYSPSIVLKLLQTRPNYFKPSIGRCQPLIDSTLNPHPNIIQTLMAWDPHKFNQTPIFLIGKARSPHSTQTSHRLPYTNPHSLLFRWQNVK